MALRVKALSYYHGIADYHVTLPDTMEGYRIHVACTESGRDEQLRGGWTVPIDVSEIPAQWREQVVEAVTQKHEADTLRAVGDYRSA